jgi:hypothetical protein
LLRSIEEAVLPKTSAQNKTPLSADTLAKGTAYAME